MTAAQFVCAVAAGLVAAECGDLAPWIARRLVVWSAHARYRDAERAAVRTEELQAVLADRPTRLLKLATAFGFTLAAVATLTTRATLHAASRASRAGFGRRAAVRTRVRAAGVLAATASSSGVLTYCLLGLNEEPSGGLALGVALSGLGLAGTWRLRHAVRSR
ncbi:hypothetical protein BTM25_34800 [Actinomadura rubteroloni]|uniref:Uncharacterized protein n=1 Tax=Actinomadura rubteroloni TaxID=1926885 RepID=A0A2P4UIF2_9ACTN|nr:hypothetical protein [Actinomadura rubteroloni]POM24842.1 hypothetical protein BTM25_34800 [Actinomadura rubteroloni]